MVSGEILISCSLVYLIFMQTLILSCTLGLGWDYYLETHETILVYMGDLFIYKFITYQKKKFIYL